MEGDGGIPAKQQPNWRSWNSFRAAGTELGPSDWLPDLSAGAPELCLDECEDDRVLVWVPVGNEGLLTALPSEAELQTATGELLDTAIVPEIQAGKAVWTGPFVVERTDWGGDPLFFEVDTTDQLEECDEDNLVDLGGWPCP